MPTFALILWPFVAMALFVGLGPGRGLIWSSVIGYLFLPASFSLDAPGLPGYGKTEAIMIGAFLGVAITWGRAGPRPEANLLEKWLFAVLVAALVISPFLTMWNNMAPIVIGSTVLPGLGLWDVQSMLIGTFVNISIWFLARRYLSTPEMHRELLRAVTAVGLFYTLLILFEVRMSPQLSNMVYDYFPHHFNQHVRNGAWRPIVFLDHGLSVGFFLTTAVLAAFALFKASDKEHRLFYIGAGVWLLLILTISRNLGAFGLALIFLPILLLLSRRMQIRAAVVVCMLFMLYPFIREHMVAPVVSLATSISEDRAASFDTRLRNEAAMLDRSKEKPIVGWGPQGRARVYNERGVDITIADGSWIITLAVSGWIKFIAYFGLLVFPIMLLWWRKNRGDTPPETIAFILIVSANLIYLIPNSTLTPIGWMMAGGLAGYVQYRQTKTGTADPARSRDEPKRASTLTTRSTRPVYTRFGPASRPSGVHR